MMNRISRLRPRANREPGPASGLLLPAAQVLPTALLLAAVLLLASSLLSLPATSAIASPPRHRADVPAGAVRERHDAPFAATPRPSIDGSPVEYLIVTSELLRPEFERLAAWRLQSGVRAVVRTTQWIEASYTGADMPARIRAFLVEAYTGWGARSVLLGGDVDQVPVRYLISRYYTVYPELDHTEIPSDLYYAGLDGDWNADGDELFGEVEDACDYLPDLHVGRAPVSTIEEARRFVDNQLAYERGSGMSGDFPASAAVLAEELDSFESLSFAEEIADTLPTTMALTRVYPEASAWAHDIDLTPQNAMAILQRGVGLVVHVGHGFRNTLSMETGSISSPDVDLLANGRRRPLIMALNCSSAAFDYNSIAEQLVNQPGGGAIAYLGMSRNAFPATAAIYQRVFIWAAYERNAPTVGVALYDSTLTLLAGVGANNDDTPHRYTKFAMTLLGDPCTPIHRRSPLPLEVEHAASVQLGDDALEITVRERGGGVVPGAQVALYAPEATLATAATGPDGRVVLASTMPAAGILLVTASAPGYLPVVSSLCTTETVAPFLHVSGVRVRGGAYAGGTAELELEIENGGGAPSAAGTVTLEIISGPATIATAPASLPALPAGTTGTAVGLALSVDADAREGSVVVLELTIRAGSVVRTERRSVSISAPRIRHLAQRIDDTNANGIVEAGESVAYSVELVNLGGSAARDLEATARVVERTTGEPAAGATMLATRSRFGDLAPAETTVGEPFRFVLDPGAAPETLALEVTYNQPLELPGGGAGTVERLDFDLPPVPPGIAVRMPTSAVRLQWTPPVATDLLGYDIERAVAASGPFERLNQLAITTGASFDDATAAIGASYYYRVRAVDTSFNRSAPTLVVAGAVNPSSPAPWPLVMGIETSSSAMLADLDRNGTAEIVVGAEGMYAWHGDGREWRDGDGDPATLGLFAPQGIVPGERGFEAAPALVDLDGDGELDLIGVSQYDAHVYVWHLDGTLHAGWPQSLFDPFNWGSPVVSDLDGDEDLELVVLAGRYGRLFAWHHDGSELRDGDAEPSTNGVFFESDAAYSYATPAAGDLDGEPGAEIIVGLNDAAGTVLALRHDGAAVEGWPVTLGGGRAGNISASPALADLTGDGQLEVVVAARPGWVHVLRHDGAVLTGWPQAASVETAGARTSSPIIVDLDGNGAYDIIFADSAGRMHAWDENGDSLSGWGDVRFAQDPDALNANATQSTPVVGDIDGNGELDILLGAEDGWIYGWRAGGGTVPGFPIRSGGEVRGSPALGDVDGDGLIELVVASSDRHLYVWDLPGPAAYDRLPWPIFRRNRTNTGLVADEDPGAPGNNPPGAPRLSPYLAYPWPNPARLGSTILFELPAPGAVVDLGIYGVTGRLVRRLAREPYGPGTHRVVWDGRGDGGRQVPSGIYWIELRADGNRATRRVVVLR